MSLARRISVLAVALQACATVAPADRVTIGRALSGVLAPKAGRSAPAPATFEFVAPPSGSVTISVESFDFDPRVEVFAASGRAIGADDDSGIATGAWLKVDAPSGATLRVSVSSQDGAGGEFLLEVSDGARDAPAGAARARASADFYRTKGLRHLNAGERERALQAFERLASIARESGDEDQGRFAAARIEYIQGAVASSKKARDDLESARKLLGGSSLGDVDRAGGLFDASASAFRELGERKLEIEALDGLRSSATRLGKLAMGSLAAARSGRAREEAGDLGLALQDHESALALLAQAPDAPAEDRAMVLSLAGRFFVGRAEYSRGLDLLEEALSLEPLSPTRLEDMGYSINAYLGCGHFARARQRIEEMGSLAGSAPNASVRSGILFTLADIEFRLGEMENAETHLEQVLELVRAEGDFENEVNTLLQLAVVHELRGEWSAAGECYTSALSIAEARKLERLRARILENLGRRARLDGNAPLARDRFRLALNAARSNGERDAESGALDGQALLALAEGDVGSAKELARQALELNRVHGAHENELFPLSTLARTALARGDLTEAAQRISEAEQILDRDDIRDLTIPEASGMRSRFASWGEIAQDLALGSLARSIETGSDPKSGVLEGWRSAGRWKGRALHEGLADRRPSSGPRVEALTTDEIAKLLGPDRLLVEYANASGRLCAYTLERGLLRLHDLGASGAIEADVRRFESFFAGPVPTGAPQEVLDVGSALYSKLLRPLLTDVDKSIRGIVIVPAGELTRVPFEALVVESPETAGREPLFRNAVFLLDRFEVSYAPSCSVLKDLSTKPPRSSRGKALILGDPVYGPEATEPSSGSPRSPWPPPLRRLEETRTECLELSTMLLASDERVSKEIAPELVKRGLERDVSLPCELFDLRLGRDAAVEVFASDLSAYRLVHLAVHGLVDASDPRRTSLVLSIDPKTDGLLTLDRVAACEMNADLVVLSACDSARGRLVQGEGVQSMANAFLRAGARGVVASLWQVRDPETESTMKSFYALHLEKGLPPAKALLEAKLEMRRTETMRGVGVRPGESPLELESAHPYFWAPFVYEGMLE